MITYYKTIKGRLQEIEHVEKDCWVNVVEPSSSEIEFLSQKLLVDPDLLIDPLDADESPRVEQHKNCMLIVSRIPLELGDEDELPYKTLPLGIIFKRDLIVTVCSKQTEVIQAFVEERIRNFNTANRERMLLQVFLKSSVLFLRYLKNINNKADEIQAILHKATRNSELLQLLNFEKSLVYFNTSLKSNELMMMRLQQHNVMSDLKENERD